MCGIIGICGGENLISNIYKGLQKLEYRGYDSSGIGYMYKQKISVIRAAGKLHNIQSKLSLNIEPSIAIGHIRWATHGPATEKNAHPIIAYSEEFGNVAVVHNGIIENHNELRQELVAQGVSFYSDTDTEVIPQLILAILKASPNSITLPQIATLLLERLEGAFALVVIAEKYPDNILVLKKAAPLLIGKPIDTRDYMLVGSDPLAFASYSTDNLAGYYLEDNQFAVIQKDNATIYDVDGNILQPIFQPLHHDFSSTEKGRFPHFMLKEIYEQPHLVPQLLSQYIQHDEVQIPLDFSTVERIHFVACGTSYIAGMIAKYWLEEYAGIAVEVDIASEFRYRHPVVHANSLLVVISQSGETSDTLAALRNCQGKVAKTIAIVNVMHSTIAREVDVALPIHAGYEIGVASTKALMNQLVVLACMTVKAANDKKRNAINLLSALCDLPTYLATALQQIEQIKQISKFLCASNSLLYIGRGTSAALALEGALKIKELSYIHAEGMPAGELKHGPIALLDANLPVIAIAPFDAYQVKTLANIQEVKARKAPVITIGNTNAELAHLSDFFIAIPEAHQFISPMLCLIPLQLLAYYTACYLERDVDQPRNLAKSVTVE